MADDLRTCRRSGCNEAAAASLSFRYETRQVWVTTLLPDGGKGTRYNLCARHADTLTVPRGWHRVDERPPARTRQRPKTAKAAPSPKPPAKRTKNSDPPVADTVQDRYARLLSELPQLAGQVPLPQAETDVVGQLTIPVPERGPSDAVIVSLTELAGARRDRVKN